MKFRKKRSHDTVQPITGLDVSSTGTPEMITYKAKKQKLSKKKLGILVSILLGLVLIMVIVGGLVKLNITANEQCSNDSARIHNKMAEAIGKANTADIKNYVEKFQKQANYEQHLNCMFPVALYYLRLGNPSAAAELYKKMKVLESKKSQVLAEPYKKLQINSLDKIQDQIFITSNTQENFSGSTFTF